MRSRETDDDVATGDEGPVKHSSGDRRRRRHKVIIHSSPFQRCVQTSVAISAGLASKPEHATPSSVSPLPSRSGQSHPSPKILPKLDTDSPELTASADDTNGKSRESKKTIRKSIVRVDAFLGEWLTPDYFELITPPPSSVMMVAGAKAELLRREDYSNLIQIRQNININQGFPGGWQSPVASPQFEKQEAPLPSLSSLGQALQGRERTNSLNSIGGLANRFNNTRPSLAIVTEQGVYQAPVPSYALSTSDPIPAGYVAHARDACVDVDYQWDSMREPQHWGNGGEYGEEWSAMHKRFRNGLQQMIQWYSTSEHPARLVTKTPRSATENQPDEEVDEDTDLVLILVTHGAGCNALIGALTNQPVLIDVGMSSLTMAVRKSFPKTESPSSPARSRSSSRSFNLPDEYDVKLIANTEHLRSSSTHSTPPSSRTPSTTGSSMFRERPTPTGGIDALSFHKTTRSLSSSSNFGSIRRPFNIQNTSSRSYAPIRQTSLGLWSAKRPGEEEQEEDAVDDMVLNFGDTSPAQSDTTGQVKDTKVLSEPNDTKEAKDAKEVKDTDAATAPETDTGDPDQVPPLGLWGSPKLGAKLSGEIPREFAPKRRWTITESNHN